MAQAAVAAASRSLLRCCGKPPCAEMVRRGAFSITQEPSTVFAEVTQSYFQIADMMEACKQEEAHAATAKAQREWSGAVVFYPKEARCESIGLPRAGEKRAGRS